MTTIYTSSYMAYRPEHGLAVAISRGLPKWRLAEAQTWPRCWLLTPGDYLKAEPDDFAQLYLAQLSRAGPARVGRALEHIAREHEADTIVCLCFEASPSDCHRGLLAQWALESAGLKITEVP
jgi:hypothetical protein